MSQIIVKEYRSTGETKHHVDNPQHFLKIVDSIRAKKHGWQLFLNGEIASELNVFGKTVCYGINKPSFFNK